LAYRSLTLMITVFLLFTACSKKEKENSMSESAAKIPKTEQNRTQNKKTVFMIRDIDDRETRIVFNPKKTIFKKIRQPVVILNIFSLWCPPCRGMLSYLSDLQRKNSSKLFVIGILANSTIDNKQLRKFMLKYHATFFISNHPDNDLLAERIASLCGLPANYPLPLTVIYKNGRCILHIKGAVPYEMLQTIVNQLEQKE